MKYKSNQKEELNEQLPLAEIFEMELGMIEDIPIDDYDFSVRTNNCLQKKEDEQGKKIHSIKELLSSSIHDLKTRPGFGENVLKRS